MVCFEEGDHNSVIPFFEKRVLQLHRIEIGLVCREGRVRVTQDRFEANFEPDRSDVVVVWNLHRRIVKEPGMFDDKLHQTRRKELVVGESRHVFWRWRMDVGPTGIVGNPFKGNGAGREHGEGQGLGRTWKTSWGQKAAIG